MEVWNRPFISKINTAWTRRNKYDLVQGDEGNQQQPANAADSEGSVDDGTGVEEEEKEEDTQIFPYRKKRSVRLLRCCSWTSSLLFSLALIIASLIFVLLLFKYDVLGRAGAGTVIDQCGSTPSEARDRGCVFETTLSLWVPPACYDPELETTYLQSPGLAFYRDVNLTQEVSLPEVRRGESIGWFVPWDHHVRHCSFAFRKLHRAAASGRKIDGYVLQYAHTEHCLKMMTDPEDWRSRITQFDMRMFPYCGKEGGFNVNSKHRGEWTG